MEQKKVFISYSSKDGSLADEVRTVLESNGIACWMAPGAILPGQDYASCIPAATQRDGSFVLR